VAELGRAFGMDVRTWSARSGTPSAKDGLLRAADFVSLHLRLAPETRGFLGRRELSLMKKTAILVNTGRGALVERDALQDALAQVVVHAGVEQHGALLLVKRAGHRLEGGKWGLPGGFLDRDETLAEGVLRELREETGWTGRVVGLPRVNSRPDRPHETRQNVA